MIVMRCEVQERIRADMKEEQAEWISCCVKILSRLVDFEVVSEADKTRFFQLSGHIWAVTKKFIEKGEIKEVAHLIRFLRYGYGAVHLYRLERWSETTLDTGEKGFGKGEPDLAATCDLIAWFYFMRMEDDEDVKSLEWYHKALAIREKELSSDQPDIAVNFIPLCRDYDDSKGLSKGLVQVQLNGKTGFLDITSKEVVPIKYDAIGFLDEGLAEVRLDEKKGFINPAGEEVVQLK